MEKCENCGSSCFVLRDGFAGRAVYEPYIICVIANGNAVVVEKEDY